MSEAGLNVRVRGAGPALVWAHALLSSMAAEDAAGLWDEAEAAGVRLVRYDARGHGDSPACASAEQASWDAFGGDLLAVATTAQAERFVAGGVSLGAAAALCAALTAPDRVSALILMSPPAIWERRLGLARRYARIAGAGERALGRLGAAGWGGVGPPWLAGAPPEPPAPARCATLFAGAARSDLPPRAALAALAATPALIIGWDGDPAHPLSCAQELHGLLPCSRLVVLSCADDYRSIGARIARFATLANNNTVA